VLKCVFFLCSNTRLTVQSREMLCICMLPAFSIPYCQSLWMSVAMYVICMSACLRLDIREIAGCFLLRAYRKVPKISRMVTLVFCLCFSLAACVNCVRWSNDGRYLASASDDKLVMIWQFSRYLFSVLYICLLTINSCMFIIHIKLAYAYGISLQLYSLHNIIIVDK